MTIGSFPPTKMRLRSSKPALEFPEPSVHFQDTPTAFPEDHLCIFRTYLLCTNSSRLCTSAELLFSTVHSPLYIFLTFTDLRLEVILLCRFLLPSVLDQSNNINFKSPKKILVSQLYGSQPANCVWPIGPHPSSLCKFTSNITQFSPHIHKANAT